MNLPSAIISSPPRKVPLSTRIVTLLGVSLSNLPTIWFCWVFFGVGILAVIDRCGQADLTSWFLFQGKIETAPGIVMEVHDTQRREGVGKNTKGTPIYAYSYHFKDHQTEHQGISYRAGMAAQTGETVAVEFLENHPDISRIQGMRRDILPLSTVGTIIFPLFGLTPILFYLAGGRKRLWLLVNGEFTQAMHTGKEATRTRDAYQTVYKVWFEFTDLKGERQKAFTRTARRKTIEGTGFEPLFYNRQKPSKIVLLSDLPRGNATLDERGQVSSCSFFAVLIALAPPLLGLAAVTYLAIKFLH